MRTRAQADFAYNGISTGEFGSRTGQSAAQVRQLITAGWFDRASDPPELLDIASVGAKQPHYRIHVSAVDRFLVERSQPRVYAKVEKAS